MLFTHRLLLSAEIRATIQASGHLGAEISLISVEGSVEGVRKRNGLAL